MASWKPDEIDRYSIGDEDVEWDDDVIKDLRIRFEEKRQFNIKYNKSRDEATREEALTLADATRNNIEELVANQIYDKLTLLLNKTRKNLVYRKVNL